MLKSQTGGGATTVDQKPNPEATHQEVGVVEEGHILEDPEREVGPESLAANLLQRQAAADLADGGELLLS